MRFVSYVLEDVGRLLRGEILISKNWDQAKLLQSKAESLVKLMEEKKKVIWNFSFSEKNHENDV